MNPPRPLADRFWEKVCICAHGIECPYCCWEWQAQKNHAGYGYIRAKIDGKWQNRGAHCVGWEILNQQPLPRKLFACHHCDNPSCCNGMHLYPGTRKQNVADAMTRGRWSNPPRSYGEQHPLAIFTSHDVLFIRALYRQGHTIASLARRRGVHKKQIAQIVYYESYKNIP